MISSIYMLLNIFENMNLRDLPITQRFGDGEWLLKREGGGSVAEL
jgi:hypothetical protein